MNRTILSIALVSLASLSMAGCMNKATPPAPNPALSTDVAPAAALPPATPVAKITSTTNLLRFFDEEAGMLCYAMDDFRSSPSCTKVAEPKKPYSDL